MSSPCTICRHPSAGPIDELLRSGRSVRSVAVELGLSRDALGRHARRHVARRTVTVDDGGRERSNGTAHGQHPLDELVVALRGRALAGDPALSREYRLALMALEDAEHAQAPAVDLASTPDWIELRTAILAALEPWPEARIAVAEAIR